MPVSHGSQTLDDLLAVHLHGEEGHPAALSRDEEQNGKQKTGFAHSGPAGEDEQIRFLHAAQQLLNGAESGRQAERRVAVADEIFDASVVVLDDAADGHEFAFFAAFDGAENRLFGLFDDVVGVLFFVARHALNGLGGGQQATAQGGALHDAPVDLGVHGHWRVVDQADERGGPVNVFKVTQLLPVPR